MIKWLGFSSILVFLVACSDPKKPNVEVFQDMMDSPAVKAQDWDDTREDKRAMRLPPENTVPRGFKVYPYPGDVFAAEKNLRNPIANKLTPPILKVGQKHYENFCLVCHGDKGAGDGPIATKMLVPPPSLITESAKKFNDGRLFHIITDGQGVMGKYSGQIHSWEDRWALVNYVRSLQKLSN